MQCNQIICKSATKTATHVWHKPQTITITDSKLYWQIISTFLHRAATAHKVHVSVHTFILESQFGTVERKIICLEIIHVKTQWHSYMSFTAKSEVSDIDFYFKFSVLQFPKKVFIFFSLRQILLHVYIETNYL